MTTKKRIKKFRDGGDTGLREGRNANIDDDTRARALAMIARLSQARDAKEDEDEEDKAVLVRRVAPQRAMERRALPERRATAAGMDMPPVPRRATAAGMDMPPVPRRGAASNLVSQIPGYTGQNAGTVGAGPARQPSDLARNVQNSMYALSPMAGPAAGLSRAALQRLAAARSAGAAAETGASRAPTAKVRSEERMADEGPGPFAFPKTPKKAAKPTLRQTRTAKERARKEQEIAEELSRFADEGNPNFKRGGKVKKMAKGGMVKCRGDGIAQRGKTKGRFVK